ncbi:hypothetical protein AWZ03_002058 [Drosophila navojoa]|uniref:Uncharacterized protein n=1 Tax=Drosophila navojoa TaxID=7232 RepID=A0A484BS56_DRONA|nr:hypothetical protein AWZ03_002058 [Drosophila navojoa]
MPSSCPAVPCPAMPCLPLASNAGLKSHLAQPHPQHQPLELAHASSIPIHCPSHRSAAAIVAEPLRSLSRGRLKDMAEAEAEASSSSSSGSSSSSRLLQLLQL